jgi:hypothetical protein
MTAKWSAIALAIAAGSVPVNASIGSCTTKNTLASYGSQLTGNGCFDIDKSFTNFGVANLGTTGTGWTTQTTSTDDIQGASNFTNVTTPWTVTATFTPAAAGDWTTPVASSGNHLEGAINMLVNSSGAFIAPGGGGNTQYPTPNPAGDVFVITSASLANVVGQTGNSGGTADSMTVTETFCVGQGACTAATTITLTATFGNNDNSASFTCGVGGSVTASIGTCQSATAGVFNFASTFHPVTLNVTDTYNLIVHSTTSDTLTSFDNVFGETEVSPEPSTWLLMGTGLVGAAFLRFRKRKLEARHPSWT